MNITALVERLKKKHGGKRKLTNVKHRNTSMPKNCTDSKLECIDIHLSIKGAPESTVESNVDIECSTTTTNT